LNDIGTDRWQLPDGVNELLPEAAVNVEQLRRQIIDRCHSWGFDFVMPPLIEYIDSLLTGTGETMDLQTFKLVDQNNGRTLGIRADMTPQVARIDAHAMQRELPNRLFYTGSVVRARGDGAGGSRTPLQFGAELFGHAGASSDIEIVRLMLDTVLLSGIKPQELLLDLGHVGVFANLADQADLPPVMVDDVFAALHNGAVPDLENLLSNISDNQAARGLASLPSMRGDASVIEKARDVLGDTNDGVVIALDRVTEVIQAIRKTHPDINIHVDLSELRGYRYHTGILFGLYDTTGMELARGGRYDDIGEAFGHSRPATGFSGDLVRLAESGANSSQESVVANRIGIFVDASSATDAWSTIKSLRDDGERVIVALPDTAETADNSGCNRKLELINDRWTVQPVTSS